MGGGLCGACVKALADFGGVKSRRLDRPQQIQREIRDEVKVRIARRCQTQNLCCEADSVRRIAGCVSI